MSDIQSTSQAEGSTVTVTVSGDETDTSQDVSTVRLKLKKPKSRKQVNWSEETVDNEHMGKKKSKCCCIYQKPKTFDESSSDEEDDECEHCQGHVELKKKLPPEPGQSPSPEGPSQSMIAA